MTHTTRHGMGRTKLLALIEIFQEELKGLEKIDRGCHGCLHSEHRKDGTCNHWKQTVPIEARAVGCDEWKYDEVPFDRGQLAPAQSPAKAAPIKGCGGCEFFSVSTSSCRRTNQFLEPETIAVGCRYWMQFGSFDDDIPF